MNVLCCCCTFSIYDKHVAFTICFISCTFSLVFSRPDPQGVVGRRHERDQAVVRERTAHDFLFVTAQHLQALARERVPELCCAVCARCQHLGALHIEHHFRDPLAVAVQHGTPRAGQTVVNARAPVNAARGDQRARGIERDVVHLALMATFQVKETLAVADVPDLARSVRGRRHEQTRLVVEHDVRDVGRVRVEGPEAHAVADVPEPHAGVTRTRRHELARRVERETRDLGRVAHERKLLRFGLDAPEDRHAIHRAVPKRISCWTEHRTHNFSLVAYRRAQSHAFTRLAVDVPDAARLVKRPREQQVRVRLVERDAEHDALVAAQRHLVVCGHFLVEGPEDPDGLVVAARRDHARVLAAREVGHGQRMRAVHRVQLERILARANERELLLCESVQ